MSQKVAYVTGGMGGIGTAILPTPAQGRLQGHRWLRPHARLRQVAGEQKALGYTFYASAGNVGDWDSTVEAFAKAKGRAWQHRCAGEQRRHHARPHVREDDARGLGRRHRNQPQQHVQRDQAGCCRHGGKRLGRIVNISSVNGERARPARPTIRPPRPACTASPWRWRRNWPPRA